MSLESADSSADVAGSCGGAGAAADSVSPFQKRPTSQRSWRAFNDKYEEWTIYWDASEWPGAGLGARGGRAHHVQDLSEWVQAGLATHLPSP